MRFGSEFGLSVDVVLRERCRHCGTDAENAVLHGEVDGDVRPGGHVFEAMPLPEVDAWRVETGGRLVPAQGRGYDRMVVTAGLDGDHTVAVWQFRKTMRYPGQLYPPDFIGSAEEWAPAYRAARVALARRICPHVDTAVFAGVARIVADGDNQPGIAPAIGYQMDLRVWCTDCGEPFVFVGDDMPVGMSPAHPTVDPAGLGLSAPLRPLQYPESWGRDRPAWGVRVR